MASLLDALMNYTGTGSPQKGQNSVSNTSTGPRDGWQYGDEDDGIVLQGMSMEEFMKLEDLAQQNVSMENVQKNVDDIAARKPVVEEEIQSGVSVEATIVNKGDTDSDSEDDGVNYHSASEYEAELAGAMGQLKVATPETSLGAADLPPPPPQPHSSLDAHTQNKSDAREAILAQHNFPRFAEGKQYSYFNLKVVFDPKKTGFENSKTFWAPPGSLIAGRYEVDEILGTAAFSTALQCVDLSIEDDGHEENDDAWVCLKVIKEGKDFFDQSLDEIKLLQYINRHGDSEKQCFLRLVDFYHKEHLFIVSELLRENLYEFGRTIVESGQPPYFTIPRLKKISHQCLKALAYIHGLGLIHCDIKPENIVMKSYSRCLCKVIDFGSSCFASDRLTTYIQSRSYRAPEVIIGHTYDGRIDIWSLGAVLAEMYAGYVLFQNDSVPRMLARITAILGPFPRTMLLRGRDTHKYFTTDHIVYERRRGH